MPDIQLPKPKEPDILSFGFDKNLNRAIEVTQSPMIYDSIEDVIQAPLVNFGTIQSGSGSKRFAVNLEKGMWMGAENFEDAPFSVTPAGDLVATSFTLDGVVLTTKGSFGGDGSDGALDTSGGTVNIDLGSASVVTKNYTTINVATNNLTFSNPATKGTIVNLKATVKVPVLAVNVL